VWRAIQSGLVDAATVVQLLVGVYGQLVVFANSVNSIYTRELGRSDGDQVSFFDPPGGFSAVVEALGGGPLAVCV
jgi:hypothetical protein